MLALHGTPDSEVPPGSRLETDSFLADSRTEACGPADRCRAGPGSTAHAVTLACVRGVYDEDVRRSVDWLLSVVGAEHTWLMRAASSCICSRPSWMSRTKAGPGATATLSWIEPTVHTLVALKKVAASYPERRVGAPRSRRRRAGAQPPLQRWRMELRQSERAEFRSAFLSGNHRPRAGRTARAQRDGTGRAARGCRRFREETKSSLAKAWLTIALRCNGENPRGAAGDGLSFSRRHAGRA